MDEHEVRGDGAVYDHETEDPRAARRRRPVADWGVGEELFDHMPSPRRRFGRSAEPARRDVHARDGRAADAGQDREVGAEAVRNFETGADAAPERAPRVPAASSAEREAQPEARSAYAAALTASVEALAPSAEPPSRSAERAATADRPAPRGGANDGRRTIVIGRTSSAAPVQRRRPPRTRGERLGHRPDRIAAWAVVLGLLLIIIAFATG